MRKIKVAIMGAGTAGLSARTEISKVTQDYLLIDPGPLGTTCARVGCMPSKVLIQVAEDFHRRAKLAEQGIVGGEGLTLDGERVMEHVRKLRDRFVKGVSSGMEGWLKSHYISGRAKFLDPNTLEVNGEKLVAERVIIATGSSPIIPGPWREHQEYFLDTDQFFELKSLPKTVGVIGLGVIGLELGQALSRLGVEVQGFDAQPVIGGISDPDIQEYAQKTFLEEFPIHFGGVQIKGPGKNGILIEVNGKTFEFEKLFLTMGRRPNLTGLGLEEIGIPLDPRKIPLFDSSTFRIKGFPIYIAGDVNGERPILHETADEGRIAGFNAVRDSDQCFVRRTKLGVVFTDPNIASVGKSFRELTEEKADFSTGGVSFEGQGRAIVKLKEKGLLRVYGHRTTGQLLGAEIFAPDGEHLAHLLAWALSLKLTVFETLSLPFYHPVIEEGLRTALRDLASKVNLSAPPLEVMRCQDPPAGSFTKQGEKV